jgi:hypothetical protein
MRLLRTGPYEPGCEKFELIEKFDSDIPKYAILSHTWGDGEVTYEHVRAPTAFERSLDSNGSGPTYENVRDQSVRECKAYSKVVAAMRQAASDEYEYIWIDTCCIDKSSSAELSEAINSMYKWYERAEVCYAILDGVPGPDAADFETEFKTSRWFTRGWTLQELLAPRHVVFFGRPLTGPWIMLGDRASLCGLISTTTAIAEEDLDSRYCQSCTVAQKMSWAAKRNTTREEDVAYCLMGLFSVNMPLLYGEGPRAFMRLQEEIMKISDDQSIFAWTSTDNQSIFAWTSPETEDAAEPSPDNVFENINDPDVKAAMGSVLDSTRTPRFPEWIGNGLLATSPKAFSHVGKIMSKGPPPDYATSYTMTNRGLCISLSLTRLRLFGTRDRKVFAANLGCGVEIERHQYLQVGIYLQPTRRLPIETYRNQFDRVRCDKLIWGVPESNSLTEIFVQQRRI